MAPPSAVACQEARTPLTGGCTRQPRSVRCRDGRRHLSRRSACTGNPWRVIFRVLLLLATAVSLYFLFPSLVDLFTQWHSLAHLEPWWLLLAVVFEATSVTALWEVQRIALRTPSWFAVGTSQLAGNAAGNVIPGGGRPQRPSPTGYSSARASRVRTWLPDWPPSRSRTRPRSRLPVTRPARDTRRPPGATRAAHDCLHRGRRFRARGPRRPRRVPLGPTAAGGRARASTPSSACFPASAMRTAPASGSSRSVTDLRAAFRQRWPFALCGIVAKPASTISASSAASPRSAPGRIPRSSSSPTRARCC
jgi:hypothetical protein